MREGLAPTAPRRGPRAGGVCLLGARKGPSSEDISAVVREVGQDSDKNVWAELSEKERLQYSLTTTKIFGAGLDSQAKSAGARAWVTGMQQVDGSLEEKNSTEEGTWSALARREVLYQEMGRAVDHDNAGAEEDLGQLVTGMDWLIAGL